MLCQTGTNLFPIFFSFRIHLLVQFGLSVSPIHPPCHTSLLRTIYSDVPGSPSLSAKIHIAKGCLVLRLWLSNISCPGDRGTSSRSEYSQTFDTSTKRPHFLTDTPTTAPPPAPGAVPRWCGRGRRVLLLLLIIKDRTAGRVGQSLPGKHLDHAVAPAADNPPAVLAPHYRARALASHDAVRGDLLRAAALLKRPEPQGGVVTSRDELAAVW